MRKKEDIRSYCNPWPHFGAAAQREKLHGEIYEEDKTGTVINDLLRSLRKGSIVEIVELGFLAPPPAKYITPRKRRALLSERAEKVIALGCVFLETETGHRSDRGHLPTMMVRAFELIGSGRRSVNRSNRGKPPIPLTQDEREKAEAIWTSRRYKNDAEREAAIKKKIGKTLKRGWCWSHFGSPSGKEPQAS